jgi:predicted lactoylglutathione lyase
MATKVFINLPVKDLEASMDFFSSLGFSFNMQFTDDKAACMVVTDSIFVMLLHEEYFKTFTKKPVSDAKKSTEVLIALDASSRDEVVSLVDKAVAAGGRIYAEAADHGWMYQHGFEDLDGHQWEVAYMDETKLPG